MHIDGKAEAERAFKKHHRHDGRQRGHYDKGAYGHADHTDKSVTGVGMDGIEVTPEELIEARSKLETAQLELDDLIKRAGELHGPLGDGRGPVAKAMASTFLDRASAEGGGVKAALLNYRAELQNVRDAIQQTLDTYQAVDTGVAEQLNAQGGGQA